MPTFLHAKNTGIFLGAHDLSTQLRTAGFQTQTDTGETTAFQSTNKSYVLGTGSASADLEGMFSYDPGVAKDIGEVLEDYAALEGAIPIALSLGKAAPVPGDVLQAGIGHLTSISYSGSVSDIVGMSTSMQLSNSAGRTLCLQNPTTNIVCTGVTQAGTGVDYTALRIGDTDAGGTDVANTNFPIGGTVGIHILSNTVNASTVIGLQSRDGASAWVDIHAPTTFTTLQTGYFTALTTAAVNDEIRWNIVSTGTGNLKILAYFIPTVSL